MKNIAMVSLIAFGMSYSTNDFARAETTPYYAATYDVAVDDDLAARQVIARLNHALDAADYKSYGSFFAPDGVFVSGFGNAVGPEQVAEALGKVAPFITNKRHVAANIIINKDGDQLVVTSYLIVFERQSELKYVGSALNVDTMKKLNGRWLVTRHESSLDPATAAYIQSLMKPKE
jgi:ketosteroid isomerase-like protein